MTRTAALLAALGLLAGCDPASATKLAPTASALVADAPKSEKALALTVDPAKSRVGFVMDAPLEKIVGELPGGLGGTVSVDPTDLRKTTALVAVDLGKLVLHQEKRDDEKAAYGERVSSDAQNRHARTWLEIGDDAPEADRTRYARGELKLTAVETDTPDVTKLSGPERTVKGTLVGELLLHGRKLERRVPFEAVLRFEGDALRSIVVKTTQPMDVGLEEFDVRPRDAFGKLAQKTLGDLAGKVAKSAPVTVELVASAKP